MMDISVRKTVIFYSALIIMLLLLSVFPGVSGFSPFSFSSQGLSSPGKGHICGTDFLGRDILSRTFAAAWISIVIGIASRVISVFIGLAAGIPAGLLPSRWARLISTVIEIFM
ncbi:MAG: ABC transporter permease, partial [Spirochaetota bacterium]